MTASTSARFPVNAHGTMSRSAPTASNSSISKVPTSKEAPHQSPTAKFHRIRSLISGLESLREQDSTSGSHQVPLGAKSPPFQPSKSSARSARSPATSPAQYPAGSAVEVSVLLRQPHGFEGFGRSWKKAPPDALPVPPPVSAQKVSSNGASLPAPRPRPRRAASVESPRSRTSHSLDGSVPERRRTGLSTSGGLRRGRDSNRRPPWRPRVGCPSRHRPSAPDRRRGRAG